MDHITDKYKKFQPKFAAYKDWENDEDKRAQAIIEMVSEAGEVLSLVQKAKRKGKKIDKDRVLDELGDVLWGLVGVMNTFDLSWKQVCNYNMKKLEERNATST